MDNPIPPSKGTKYLFSIRQASQADIDVICAFDHIAQSSSPRRKFIRRSVDSDSCFVIETRKQVAGYIVLEYSFYEEGFISMLYIHPEYRHQGAGEMLMRHVEPVCQTAKLFASTNLSNHPMQSLFTKLGYKLSGVIHDLDEGDPELVYVKYVGEVQAGHEQH
jgi:ribosomal protein S18 acetylase RimI-like enzyme